MYYINKGSTFSKGILDKIIPIIVIYLLIKLIFAYITAIISYRTWIDWWNGNGGKNYRTTFDIYSMACFNSSKVLFNTRQLLIPGSASLNETDILLLQSIVLNNARVIPDQILSQNFVTPTHVCEGIAWNDGDLDIFRQAIDHWYGGSTPGVNKADWYDAWNTGGRVGPDDAEGWTKITANECGGFWPHQNGCTGFFDMTGGVGASAKAPYDLGNFTMVGDKKDTISPAYPGNLANSLNTPLGMFKDKNGKTYSGPIGSPGLYYPGKPNDPQSSWAQLFADFGVVYSNNVRDTMNATMTSTTVVPILDQTSNSKLWYSSGQSTDDQGNFTYGLNFFGLYYMNPPSYIFTSWVGNMYDDPTTGIIFDPQAIKNLVGMSPGAKKSSRGGWMMFLKGFNTNITSYDSIMNDIFAEYATNYTAVPAPDKDKSCSTSAKWSSTIGNVIGMAVNVGMLIPGEGQLFGMSAKLFGALFGAGLGIGQSALSNQAQCGDANPF